MVISDKLAILILGRVDIIAVGVAEIAGSSHFGFDGRPGEGRAFGPRRLLADDVFGVEAATVDDFYAIFGELADKRSMTVLGDIRGEFGFELDEEVGTLRDFLFRGKGQGNDEKQKSYGDSFHESSRAAAAAGSGSQVLGRRP